MIEQSDTALTGEVRNLCRIYLNQIVLRECSIFCVTVRRFMPPKNSCTNGGIHTGGRLCFTKPMKDSPCESSAITGGDEQTDPPELQDQELAGL